jgi:hypothetical protein
MAKKSTEPEPAIRRSFLIVGGVALAAALLGFIVMNFVLGGGGGGEVPADDAAIVQTSPLPGAPGGVAQPPAATPQPTDNALRPGGRDPFIPIGGAPAPG